MNDETVIYLLAAAGCTFALYSAGVMPPKLAAGASVFHALTIGFVSSAICFGNLIYHARLAVAQRAKRRKSIANYNRRIAFKNKCNASRNSGGASIVQGKSFGNFNIIKQRRVQRGIVVRRDRETGVNLFRHRNGDAVNALPVLAVGGNVTAECVAGTD